MLVVQIILHDELILYQQSTVKKRDFSAMSYLIYKHFDNQSDTTSFCPLHPSDYNFIIIFHIN